MGGIDKADEDISLYRVSIRGKKLFFRIISHCIDVAEQNAWEFHQHEGGKLDHLAFCRRIVTAILESNKRVISSRERPGCSSQIDPDMTKLSTMLWIYHLIVLQERKSNVASVIKNVQHSA